MSHTDDLRSFYNREARKYSQTRKKHWKDAEYFLQELQNYNKKKIRILDVGCGSGRIIPYLEKVSNKTIEYIGVDISEGLLKYAKEEAKYTKKNKYKFICNDISNFIKTQKQESFDFIFCIASFQHIAKNHERRYLTKNFYRVLEYEGKIIMTNRSFSHRFIKAYLKNLIMAFRNFFKTGGQSLWNDLLIPWKQGKKKYDRFYHIFTINELKNLIIGGGFIAQKIAYLDGDAKEIAGYKNAHNTILIAQKGITQE